MNAEERARSNLPEGMFDNLPNRYKQKLIEKEQKIIDQEQVIIDQERILSEQQQQFIEQQQQFIEREKLKEVYRILNVVNVDKDDYEEIATSYLTITSLDGSIEEFNLSRSIESIKQTKEYKELLNILIQQCLNETVSYDEANNQLNNLIDVGLRTRRRNYDSTRTSLTVLNDIRERSTRSHVVGSAKWNYPIDEADTELLHIVDGYSLDIPTRDYIISISNNLRNTSKEKVNRQLEHPIHRSTITCYLRGSERFFTWTKKLVINTEDGDEKSGWYDKFKHEIFIRVLRTIENDNYEVKGSACIVRINQGYIISEIRDVTNWFKGPVSIITKFEDFSLFTANNKDINCVQQCVEYLGYKYEKDKNINDIITDKKIVKYHPIDMSISQVREMNDLVMIFGDDDTNDCKNVIRILEVDGHMGIITQMKNKARKSIMTKTKKKTDEKLKLNDHHVELFVDIETFQDEYHNHIPYLICWKTKDTNVEYETMEGCVERFVTRILEQYKGKTIILYAWYGSGYDYQHIIKYLKRSSIRDNLFIRGNNIIHGKLHYKDSTIVHLKDPYLFILCGLGKAAKAFGVLNKGEFSHDIINNLDDLDKILDKWYFIREEYEDSYDETGKTMLISARTWEEFEDGENHQTILDRAIEYCSIDVIAMQQIWFKFTEIVYKELGINIDINTFTLSQMSMKLMIEHLPKNVKLYVPDKSEYNFIKNAIYGGRVVAKNGSYEEDIIYADVVSLYPSAQKLLEHGYGEPIKVNKINWNKQGIYLVELTSKNKPHDYMEFVPFRDELGKLSYHWREYWKGIYTTYDLLIARSEGYDIHCITGIEYQYKGNIFNEFIDKLFKLKAESTGVIRWVAKIALNGGGYGKFVQKPIDKHVLIVPKNGLQQYFENEDEYGKVIVGTHKIDKPEFYDLDSDEWEKMIIKLEGDIRYATQIGVSILSGSRYRLYTLVKDIKDEAPNMEVIYSDTDSVFIRKKTLGDINLSKYFGKELGQLDNTVDGSLNNIINKIYIAGPKMYGYEYYDKNGFIKNSLRLKGVPGKMVTLDQLKHIVKEKDNKVIYSMMSMRRNLINIKNIYIDKEIKQT